MALIRTLVSVFALFLPASAASAQLLEGPPGAERRAPESRSEMQLSFAPVVREAAPAVVNVYSSRMISQRTPFAGDPLFERFFGPQVREREVQSLGSGVIVDETGVIVTNNHVVRGAQELRVVLADRREYDAEVLLADERTDLAVLKIEAEEALPVLRLNDDGQPEVGDLVLAIGNPFGVGQTVTSGIVSATARTDVGITDYAFFIQTDAAVNPGNSGGALVAMDGELIGVNTAIFSRSGGSNGIGFAIPVEMVRRIVDAALSGEELVRPWLGAQLQPVDSALAQSLGLERPRGAIVAQVFPESPAARAGLERGDVLLEIDGAEINDEAAARFAFATRAVGDNAQLTLLRDGEEESLRVRAAPPPGDPEGEKRALAGRHPLSGATVVELSPAFNEANRIDAFETGVVVFEVNRRAPARYFGFQPGDRIVEVAGVQVSTIEDLANALEANEGARLWPVEIQRRGERLAVTLRL